MKLFVSDELSNCEENQFECETGDMLPDRTCCGGPCIKDIWANDGEKDCLDGSDEFGELLYTFNHSKNLF